jgi:2-polyprenyl-6-methoxyphenol hydroxylase-like FAD-dependent oxidoreductase
MSASQRRRAIVIGGSLGGLFTALCLRAIGWEVDIFERSPQWLDSRGGGLVLQPDVLDALRFAGVSHPLELGVPSRDRIFLNRAGQVIQRMLMPQTQIAWSVLYSLMKAALPAGSIHGGEAFTGLTQAGDEVTATFASGRTERGALLVGADGPHSTVRQVLVRDSAPAYAGYVAWRGLLAEPDLGPAADALLDDVFAFQDGREHQMLTYFIPGEDGATRRPERRLNWVWYRKLPAGPLLDEALTDKNGFKRPYSIPPGALKPADADVLRAAATEQLAPVFESLVASTAEPFMQLIQDYQAPRMVFGRAILLGDAAFVARPHTGAGAGKAAGNALALGLALRAHGQRTDAGLAEWQHEQWNAGMQLTRWGISLGENIMGRPRGRHAG